jgi:hypothetical protein
MKERQERKGRTCALVRPPLPGRPPRRTPSPRRRHLLLLACSNTTCIDQNSVGRAHGAESNGSHAGSVDAAERVTSRRTLPSKAIYSSTRYEKEKRNLHDDGVSSWQVLRCMSRNYYYYYYSTSMCVVLHSSRKKERQSSGSGWPFIMLVGSRARMRCGAVRAQSGGRDPKRRRARRDRTRRSYGLQGATQPRRPAAIMMRGDARPHAGISLCCCFGAPAFAGFFPSPLLSPRSRNLLSPSVLPSCDSGRCRTECSFFLRKLPGYPLPSSHRPRFAKKKFPPSVTNQLAQRKGKPNQTPRYPLPLSLLSGVANLLRTKLRMKRSETGIFSALDLDGRRERHRIFGRPGSRKGAGVRPPAPPQVNTAEAGERSPRRRRP